MAVSPPLGRVRNNRNVMLAVTACPHIFQSIRLSVLLLNHFSQVLGAVVHLIHVVQVRLAATCPASQAGPVAGNLVHGAKRRLGGSRLAVRRGR